MDLKNSIAEYTEPEFLEFMKEIFKENFAKTDDQLDILLAHFKKIPSILKGQTLFIMLLQMQRARLRK